MRTNKQAPGSNTRDPRALSRRDFLANTALIGAGLAVGPLSWATSSDQPKDINTMKTRKLGTLEVSELGAGCMSISANYGPPAPRAQGINVIRKGHERGVTFFDTAEVYGPDTSEELSEKHSHLSAIKSQSPPNSVLTLKEVQEVLIADQSTSRKWLRLHLSALKPIGSISITSTGSIEKCRSNMWPARSKISLRKEKFCTSVSLGDARTIRRAHAVQPVAAIQTEYSFMERGPERNGVLEACEEPGIGFVPWGPVGMGYLTGKMDANTRLDLKTDLRSGFYRFSPENIAANMPVVDFLRRFAEKKNATPAQIALAWLMAEKPLIVPIPGTRNMDHLKENLGAINVQLTPADLSEIQTAFSAITVHGGRMNEMQMQIVDQTV